MCKHTIRININERCCCLYVGVGLLNFFLVVKFGMSLSPGARAKSPKFFRRPVIIDNQNNDRSFLFWHLPKIYGTLIKTLFSGNLCKIDRANTCERTEKKTSAQELAPHTFPFINFINTANCTNQLGYLIIHRTRYPTTFEK